MKRKISFTLVLGLMLIALGVLNMPAFTLIEAPNAGLGLVCIIVGALFLGIALAQSQLRLSSRNAALIDCFYGLLFMALPLLTHRAGTLGSNLIDFFLYLYGLYYFVANLRKLFHKKDKKYDK